MSELDIFEGERLRYDFTSAAMVEQLRQLASEGYTDRMLAWRYHYKTAAGFRDALERQGADDAYWAIREARVERELALVQIAQQVASSPSNPGRMGAVRWLAARVEVDIAAVPEATAKPGVTMPQTPEEIRERLRPVRDAQRGVLQ